MTSLETTMGKAINEMNLEELKAEHKSVQELKQSIVNQIDEIDADENESSLEISGELSEHRNNLERRLTELINLSKQISEAITRKRGKDAFGDLSQD